MRMPTGSYIDRKNYLEGILGRDIKELAEYFETVFNINLGDFYHTFVEIRERKGSRSLFLDKLITLLEKRMDGLDNK